MKPKLLPTLILATFALAPAAWAEEFKATLSGDQEAPTPVVTATTGKLKLHPNKEETEMEITLTVEDGVRIQQAHLHCGAVGVAGPVIVFLGGNHPAGLDIDGKWVSNATMTNTSLTSTSTGCGATISELIASIRAGNVYANVHSVAFPGGVIRGQVEAH